MAKFEKNLSEGSVVKQLVLFSLPFLLSNIIQSLYSVADMMVVGNVNGEASMSGVNIGGQITFILTNLIIGLCTGGSVLIAQYVGKGDHEKMKKTISTLFSGLLIAGAVVTAVMIFLKDPVLRLINTPEESFREASDYLFFTVLGIIFIFAYNALAAVLRGMGDSWRPLIFIGISCAVNVGLDLWLVAGMKMGARGAAIATVVSQAVSVALCVAYLIKRNFVFDFKKSSFVIDRAQLRLIVKVGAPMAVQNSVVSLSFLFITSLVNIVGGVTGSAAVGAVGKFNGFAILPAAAMSNAVSTVCAQNIGAEKWDRAVKTCKIGVGIALCFSLSIFALVQWKPEAILRLFNPEGDEMIKMGTEYLRTFSFDYLFIPFAFCINGLYIGAGHTLFTLINGCMSSLVVRIPASYIFGIVLGKGLSGIGLGAPCATFLTVTVIIIYYFSGRWRVNAVKSKTAE